MGCDDCRAVRELLLRPLYVETAVFSWGCPGQLPTAVIVSVSDNTKFKLSDAHRDTFASTGSHTTRKARAGEIEGVNYFFISPAEFSSLVSQNAFVEYTFFNGHSYGTSKRTIADQTAKGLVVVLDIEMEGVKQMKANPDVDARYVFIKPPSLEEDIQEKLAQARAELEYADTPGIHDIIIVNDDLEKAFQELDEFVYRPTV
ncbi:guanylate kinase [Zalerion maritima]|uniref:Guanylate kinase n=1 Tax=Zalerion maritima TaxID=339359 RepID=A0AAD5RYG4_9PEZI|nr:guanylate kinase [Zalerion maritima]